MSYRLPEDNGLDFRTALVMKIKEAVERELLDTCQLLEVYSCMKLIDRLDKLNCRNKARIYALCRMLDDVFASGAEGGVV